MEWVTLQFSAGKPRSTTTLKYILAHILQTEFREGDAIQNTMLRQAKCTKS
jgi:hypothetical protein